MNSFKSIPICKEDTPAFLPRTTSTSNFAEVLSKNHRARSRQSCSRVSAQSSRRSESNGSENSQVLYMADRKKKKTRKASRSLSCARNGNRQYTSGTPQPEVVLEEEMDEDISWNIIDREIFEWQSVCQTGRPYWWSPQSKNARLKRLSSRVGSGLHPKIWMREADARPNSDYGAQRRAVSDNYLADPSSVHDLAHLVAVQLLGSCFTLSPEQNMGTTYTSQGSRSCNLRDPPMISSLRMHTHFRYSPSFGHQAQNTSPVHLWPSTFDGPPPIPSPLALHEDEENSDVKRRRRLWNTDKETRASLDVENDMALRQHCKVNLDPDTATACYENEGISSNQPTKHQTLHNSQTSATKKPVHKLRSRSESRHTEDDANETRMGAKSCRGRSNYRLQAVIRSEPHPVFVQPVKELVVRRWRNFRRRLSGSLHSPLPARTSAHRISASESHESGESSPIMSSDGKARRRRAQERGYIESSSMESTPHHNSPASGCNSPVGSERQALRPPPVLSWSSVMIATDSIRNQNPSPTSSLLATCGSIYSRQELNHQPTRPSFSQAQSVSSRDTKRRKSMLSEVFTPDDAYCIRRDRNMLSIAGSEMASPIEDRYLNLSSRRPLIADMLNHPISDSVLAISDLQKPKRPTITRTSTTGTQIFTPSEDGIELDGLPAGPSRDHWFGKGDRRERTYLL